MIRSMTGFATAQGGTQAARWSWTLRSVNGKGLDLKLRVPPGWEAVEAAARKLDLPLARGTISAVMKTERDESASTVRADPDALAAVVAAAREAEMAAAAAGLAVTPPNPGTLLSLGGVLVRGAEAGFEPGEGEVAAALATLTEAADGLAADRAGEGRALASVLCGHLDRIEALVGDAEREAAAALPALRDRLRAQISDLLASELAEERLAQEAALLAVRADVREETDRLRAHVGAARALIDGEEPAGRKLEFLAQEFAREANTLTSKAASLDLKRIGLDLKHVVDQVREQVLNVE